MTTIVCPRCKATTMRVVKTDTCDDCEYNDCSRSAPGCCERGKCPDDKQSCGGYNSNAGENEECDLGHSFNRGCMLATCAMCGTPAEYLPVIEP